MNESDVCCYERRFFLIICLFIYFFDFVQLQPLPRYLIIDLLVSIWTAGIASTGQLRAEAQEGHRHVHLTARLLADVAAAVGFLRGATQGLQPPLLFGQDRSYGAPARPQHFVPHRQRPRPPLPVFRFVFRSNVVISLTNQQL